MAQNIQQVIIDSLFNNDNATRQQSEQTLFQIASQNPGQFLLECTSVLQNEQQNIQIRFACGTVFKRIITQNKPSNQHFWLQINETLREQIKNNLLSTLITEDENCRRISADNISCITSIELPLKMWEDIIPNLSQNLNHQDVDIKKAAIMTLGFICEQLKQYDIMNCLDTKQIENILMGILLGMQKSESNLDVKLLATKALSLSLLFMNQLLEKEDIRVYVLDLVVSCCLEQKKQEIQVHALQCLIDFVKLQYHNMQSSILTLYKLISHLILSPNIAIAIPAVEIWYSIALEDVELQKASAKLINIVADQLIVILLQNLVRQPDEENEEGGLNIQESTSNCLMKIVESIKDEAINTFQNFISNTIRSEDWTHRQAGIIAFGALMEGPSKLTLISMIQTAFPIIVLFLNDKNKKVVESTVETLRRISEFHPQCILQNMQQILPFLVQYIQTDNFKLFKTCCQIFSHLADGVNNQNQEYSQYFLQNVDNILNILFQIAMKQYSVQFQSISEIAFASFLNLIYYATTKQIAAKYLDQAVQIIIQNANMINIIQKNALLAVMHGAILIIDDYIGDQRMEVIYSTIINDFKSQNAISSDSIFVIGALATACQQSFTKYLQESLQYIKIGMKKIDEPELIKASISALGDISRGVTSQFIPYIDEFMPLILNMLKDPNFDREYKLFLYMTLADVCLSNENGVVDYMDQIIQIYHISFETCLQFSISNDLNLQFYADQLKEKLVETLTCFLHSMIQQNQNKIIQFAPYIANFIFQMTDIRFSPTVEFLKNSLALLTDIAAELGQSVAEYVKTPNTQILIDQLSKFSNIQDNDMIIRYSVGVLQKLN